MTAEFPSHIFVERRCALRLALQLRFSYQCLSRGNVTPAEAGLSTSISAGGVSWHSERELSKGQLLMLTLALPCGKTQQPGDEPGPSGASVHILSRVAWSSPSAQGGFNLGVQFLDMDRDDRSSMRRFLEDYQLYPANSRLYL